MLFSFELTIAITIMVNEMYLVVLETTRAMKLITFFAKDVDADRKEQLFRFCNRRDLNPTTEFLFEKKNFEEKLMRQNAQQNNNNNNYIC